MFARALYLTKAIGLTLVPTHRMMADGMTKVVDKDKFFKCRDYALRVCRHAPSRWAVHRSAFEQGTRPVMTW